MYPSFSKQEDEESGQSPVFRAICQSVGPLECRGCQGGSCWQPSPSCQLCPCTSPVVYITSKRSQRNTMKSFARACAIFPNSTKFKHNGRLTSANMTFSSLRNLVENPQETLFRGGEDISRRACQNNYWKTISIRTISTISVCRRLTHLSEKALIETECKITWREGVTESSAPFLTPLQLLNVGTKNSELHQEYHKRQFNSKIKMAKF